MPVLSAINLSSAGGVAVTAPGEWPYVTNVSISPDGKRTYALVGGAAVWAYDQPVAISVIDSDPTSSTYNTQIATIALPGATDVAFSPDSRRAYVLMNERKDGPSCRNNHQRCRRIFHRATREQHRGSFEWNRLPHQRRTVSSTRSWSERPTSPL